MEDPAREIDREIRIPSGEREVAIGTVSAGETWSFSVTGLWKNGLVRCGPDGYRNFLADALQIAPRVAEQPWFSLIGEIKGHPRTTFPIGAGCTRTFDRSGTLVAFANDSPDGYANNKGAVTLRLRRGGLAPAPAVEFGGFIGWWHGVRDMASRTKGIPLIAALTVGASAILVFMQQGQDLVRGIGEDDFLRSPLLQTAFAVGLLFLALEAWSWSRIIIDSNFGADRAGWRPRQLLIWTPRILGVLPFVACAWALLKNPARNTWFVLALIALGAIFFVFVIKRQDVQTGLRRRAAARGMARHFDLIQRYWVIFSLVAAVVLMAVATLWPTTFGAWLGAPAVVFIGLGVIIPVVVIGIQIGSSLRVPVVGAMLLWAVVVGLWMDNHAVGRRAFSAAVAGPTDRLTLKQAYDLWKTAQAPDSSGKRTMVLIAVQGGASRAGYWTAAALAALHDAAKDRHVDLDSHIFAISSVSGGSVGSVGYEAMLQSAPQGADFKPWLLKFAGRDALGPAMTGMLFPDLLQRFLPLAFLPDRAETLERSWEDSWAVSGVPDDAASVMSQPFLNLAPKLDRPWRPILIVQGASEDTGRRVLTSGVKFTGDEVDAEDFLDNQCQDVAASTAILNGARFPLVSPGGTFFYQSCPGGDKAPRIEDHVLDGGYFDNAGAETLRELVRAIRLGPGRQDNLDIIFVLIGYENINRLESTPALATNDVFAPLFGVFASLNAHEGHLAREMKLFDQKTLGDANPYRSRVTNGNVDYEAIALCKGKDSQGEDYEPPMDWTLSAKARAYIDSALIAGSHACAADANVKAMAAIVDKLGR
jgi:hypothetical protein